jgi:hypothetical protein
MSIERIPGTEINEPEAGAAASEPIASAEDMDAERAARQKTFARRALLQAGWAVPAILAIGRAAEAAGPSQHEDISF